MSVGVCRCVVARVLVKINKFAERMISSMLLLCSLANEPMVMWCSSRFFGAPLPLASRMTGDRPALLALHANISHVSLVSASQVAFRC